MKFSEVSHEIWKGGGKQRFATNQLEPNVNVPLLLKLQKINVYLSNFTDKQTEKISIVQSVNMEIYEKTSSQSLDEDRAWTQTKTKTKTKPKGDNRDL